MKLSKPALKDREDRIAEKMYELSAEDFVQYSDLYRSAIRRMFDNLIETAFRSFMEKNPGTKELRAYVEDRTGQDFVAVVKNSIGTEAVGVEVAEGFCTTLFSAMCDSRDRSRKVESMKKEPYFTAIVDSGLPVDGLTTEKEYDFMVRHYGSIEAAMRPFLDTYSRIAVSSARSLRVQHDPEQVREAFKSTQLYQLELKRVTEAYQRIHIK